jgi:hypothetical protein
MVPPMSDPQTQAIAMAEATCGMLRMARALVDSRRTVDLSGLQNAIGRLCAATFDLEYEEGRKLRPHLTAVLGELDSLEQAMNIAAFRGKGQ